MTPDDQIPRRRILGGIYLLIVAGLAATGTWYATHPAIGIGLFGHWDPPHITPDDDLKAVGDLLRDFRQKHGRYPTNEEGLTALDNFDLRATVPLWCSTRGDSVVLQPLCEPAHDRSLGDIIHKAHAGLATSMPTDARPPATQHEGGWPKFSLVHLKIGLKPAGSWLPSGPAGVYSGKLLPYVYENRIGYPPSAFSFSPVNRDSRQEYSVEVDDGIYVYSVDGKRRSEEAWGTYWYWNRPRLFGWILVGTAGILVLLRIRRAQAFVIAGAVMIVAMIAGRSAKPSFTCYAMYFPPGIQRDSETLSAQHELLDKYRAAGVISRAAYQRAVDGLDLDKVLVPTTGPETGM